MTQQERDEIRSAIRDAKTRGDKNEEYRLIAKLPMPPRLALSAKESFGTQWLLDKGFNLSLANQQFGENWLYE